MSNGHIPNHNNTRRERLANHTPWRDRVVATLERFPQPPRWAVPILVATLAAALFGLGATTVHHVGKVHGGSDHGGHSHAAAATVREVIPQHCLEALSRAETAMDAAREFGRGMEDFHAGALALLQRGDAGRPVKHLQRWLNERGADLKVDGSYGPDTEKAVEAYRKEHGKHSERSTAHLEKLANTREGYESAAEQCRGGES